MSFTTPVIVALALLMTAIGIWAAARALRIAWHLRGVRVVTCPETGRPAAVTVNRRRVFALGLFAHTPQLRLRTCSRWSGRGRCDEPCLWEAVAPVSWNQAIAERALKGKACAFCRKPIERVAFLNHYPALLQPDGTTVEWPAIPPGCLDHSLLTQPPVCWDCHVTETFRRRYPELVTERPWRRA
jgi:hypothetical protein